MEIGKVGLELTMMGFDSELEGIQERMSTGWRKIKK
jgi:hypothetical protein